MNSIQKIEKKHSYFTQMGISPFKKVCMPRVCTIKSTVLSWQMISSFWTANYFVERILCSIKIKVDDSEIQNEDKCMSNNTPQKKTPWDEGSLFRITSKEGRTKMEMTATCTTVTHLSADFLMLLMSVYQIVSQFITWSSPYTLFLKYFCQISLPLLGFRLVPYISLHYSFTIVLKIHTHKWEKENSST